MKEKIKEEEQMAEQMVDGEEKDCQLGLIEYLKNITYCKDDCLFCQSLSDKKIGDKPYKFTCAGKEKVKEIKDYPQNACKDWVPDDFPAYSCGPVPERDTSGGKICTCSTDSCDPTQSVYITNPPNTNPDSTNADNNVDPDSTNADNNVNPDSTNADDNDVGNTTKDPSINDTSQDSNHASRRCILNYLLTLAVFIAFRFSF